MNKWIAEFELEDGDTMPEHMDLEYKGAKIDFHCKPLEQEPTTENNLGVDCISRADALRVAKNEYKRGWHNALCKALSEEYSIHCEEGNFRVIQEETITGLGLSMNCALGKDVESYMSTMPSVTPKEPIIDKIRAEIEQIIGERNLDDYDFCSGLICARNIIDKVESEEK